MVAFVQSAIDSYQMRYRWYHRPELHTANSGVEKRASWLELLYDLIFVASFIQLGNGLARDISTFPVAAFIVVFSALWFTWTGFTVYSNRFNVDDFAHRTLVFAQMLAISGMTAFASGVLAHDAVHFSFSYAAAQFIIAIMYFRSWKQARHGLKYSRFWGVMFFCGGCAWLAAAFVPEPFCYILWAAGLFTFIGGSFSRHSRDLAKQAPYDQAHLSNRYGLLTIIVLGEAFVQVMSGISQASAGYRVFSLVAFTLLVTVSIWWTYFDDIGSSRIKPSKFAFNFWLYGHIPLHGAIVALGIAILKITQLDLSEIVPDTHRWLLCSALAIVFLSVALLDWATERKQAEVNERVRITARVTSGALIFVLAPAGRGMSPSVFLGLVALLCVAQVFFDMIMAPLDFTKESEDDEKVLSTSQVARNRQDGQPAARLSRTSVRNAIRKGTPTELRRDLYFALIETTWPRFLFWVIFAYLLINAFFAGIFMIQPGSIGNARIDSFSDAFYFSVQTLATIGYGNLYPKNDFGNMVTIVEALVGIMGVAFVTGLMFAKASKPRAGIIFSSTMVITVMDGKRYLMFRTGNTRGNEIVSAELTVAVLKDEVSLEGHHMRRMHDIKLSRHRSPFFALTWLALHEINEQSPFYNVHSQADIDPAIVSLTCILMGHDSTYGQTIYTRHIYYPEDIHVGSKFIDVLGETPDGRFVVDYSKFHDVTSEQRI
jgi:inward rectifier potassium channel